VAPWPAADRRAADAAALKRFGSVQEIVGAIRSIRAEYGVQPGQTVRATIANPGADARAALAEAGPIVTRLAKLSALETGGEPADPKAAATTVLPDGTSVSVPLGDLVDVEKECARLRSEVDRLDGAIRGQEAKLDNQQFVSKAPATVVEREREKLAAWREQASVLVDKRRRLGCPA
jgi:valyl-tRNA synthetase